MSKLYNQEIPISIIPKQIEVMLNKNIGSKMSVNQNTNKNTEYVKKFSGAVKLFADKIKAIFTTTSQWLDDTKKINSNKSLENFNPIYLKIWECLVIKENWRSTYQLKLISARFQMDIKVNLLGTLKVISQLLFVQQNMSKLLNVLSSWQCDIFWS